MSIIVAISIYCAMIAVVSSLLTYYFKVIRPKEEQELANGEHHFD
jgi:hypothetical protein